MFNVVLSSAAPVVVPTAPTTYTLSPPLPPLGGSRRSRPPPPEQESGIIDALIFICTVALAGYLAYMLIFLEAEPVPSYCDSGVDPDTSPIKCIACPEAAKCAGGHATCNARSVLSDFYQKE